MLIMTQRFGRIEIPEREMITMARPILGFEMLRTFTLLELPDLLPFRWFQSVEEPTIAFLVVNPAIFFPEYRIKIHSNEIAELGVSSANRIETYVIVTLGQSDKGTTANLQGPLLINPESRLAKQLVLGNSQYDVNHPLVPTRREEAQVTMTEMVEELEAV
jgi:flagellar assembly factor FliW